MKEEIKEIKIYKANKSIIFINNGIAFSQFGVADEILDLIINLQEQLHQASLDIQELTEKDIGCPSWCDKLTNLQEENRQTKLLKERYQLEKEDYKQRNEKAIKYIDRMTRVIDYDDDEFITWKHIEDIEKILRGDDKE